MSRGKLVTFYALLTVDNAQSHVTAFRPISEAGRSWSDDNTFLRPLYRSACVRQHVQLTTVRFFSAQCFTAHNQRIQISDKTLEFSSTLDSVIYAVSVVHKKRLNKQSWFWRILEFLEMRFMCSAYHWTNNKLATVS